VSIKSLSTPVFDTLLEHAGINLDQLNADSESALSMTLYINTSAPLDENSMAAKLINKGCAVNTAHPVTGDTLLHNLVKNKLEAAAIFLAKHKSDVNIANKKVSQ